MAHETHRGRILFNPWITCRLLDRFEHLKLCCDFSHWVCVSERLIDDHCAEGVSGITVLASKPRIELEARYQRQLGYESLVVKVNRR